MPQIDTPQSTAKIAGRPIHPMTVALPITLLVVTFVCDVAFHLTEDSVVATVSLYALAAGITFGAVAAVWLRRLSWEREDQEP